MATEPMTRWVAWDELPTTTGAKLLLDLVEVGLNFRDGTGRQHGDAGQLGHVHDLDAAGPALQQPDRGVERPAGRR